MAVFLHTRVRVSDLDQSIKWYADHLGFVVMSRSDKSPAGNQIVHMELPGNRTRWSSPTPPTTSSMFRRT